MFLPPLRPLIAVVAALAGRSTALAQATVAPPAASASVAGHYYLEGVMETASELLLRPDGRFAFILSYGAVDQSSEGRWRIERGGVLLTTDGSAHAPAVRLKAATGRATDSIVVRVLDTLGAPIRGVEIDVERPSGTAFGRTSREGYVIAVGKGDAPTALAVGYDVVDFLVTFPLKAPLRALYTFEFDRGDLGRIRFESQRLEIADGRLILAMNGRRMRYVRR